jgi:hypothetical protein
MMYEVVLKPFYAESDGRWLSEKLSEAYSFLQREHPDDIILLSKDDANFVEMMTTFRFSNPAENELEVDGYTYIGWLPELNIKIYSQES